MIKFRLLKRVGFLKKNPLQPHKSEYWLHPKIENWEYFVKRVALICQFILMAVFKECANLHLISIDEKTCIQAIERYVSVAPNSKGGHQRKEYEYIRHGTTTLIAANNVENGKIVHHHLGPLRDEKIYAEFVQQTVEQFPEMDKIVILSDQLNTHMSETIVLWIAQMEEYDENELGIKGRSAILKSMQTRKRFLERPHHRIQFVFTPKHCSWLNPIENWFAKLQKQVLKNGNFSSVKELEQRIEKYIIFSNEVFAKPLKWKFKGFYKAQKLKNIIVN